MPRDISGNYTLPAGINPVVTNTLIDVNWANPTLSDIATQLNNVFTRDGLLGPLAPVKFVDGTTALPGITFNSATGTGFSRSATKLSFSWAGVEKASLNGSGINLGVAATDVVAVTGALSVTKTTAGTLATLSGQNTSEASNIRFGTDAGDNPNIAWQAFNWDTGNARFDFRVGGLTAADAAWSLDTSKNFLVGTTTALNAAANRGNITLNGSTSAILSFGVAGNNLGYAYADATGMQIGCFANQTLAFITNNTNRLLIANDGRIYGTALHNNAGSLTGTANQYIASGYSPGIGAAGANVASFAIDPLIWTRVGNVVTLSGGGTVTCTAAGGTSTELFINLPIPSNFLDSAYLSGVSSFDIDNAGGRLRSDVTNDRISMVWVSSITLAQAFKFTCSYVVA